MADLDIPEEVIAAQRAYDEADAEVHRIVASMPSGSAVAAGEAEIPDDLADELHRARMARLDRMEELRNLPWWDEVESVLKAEMALRKAARGDGPQDAA
ncbi:hypothetical protein [Nonomuraea rubra]|uniref:Uncharacterized protein n=1 Tax=Nonomuraea rubra TaxID=46180 RepID=A0A7X0P6E6_9ACTN|nr:hypothetical protein [Nonomuraea rubra]MBB6556119.1 hypothetical protein [Nonomuraea rubra]